VGAGQESEFSYIDTSNNWNIDLEYFLNVMSLHKIFLSCKSKRGLPKKARIGFKTSFEMASMLSTMRDHVTGTQSRGAYKLFTSQLWLAQFMALYILPGAQSAKEAQVPEGTKLFVVAQHVQYRRVSYLCKMFYKYCYFHRIVPRRYGRVEHNPFFVPHLYLMQISSLVSSLKRAPSAAPLKSGTKFQPTYMHFIYLKVFFIKKLLTAIMIHSKNGSSEHNIKLRTVLS
jgi:hypothetical protein